MKEKIYGWYPSIKNVYNERIGVPSNYELECLYKFQGTMYQTKPCRPGPDNLTVQGHAPPAPPSQCRPSTAMRSTSAHKTQTPQRPKTAPIPQYRPIKKLRIPTPQQCWSNSLVETAFEQQYTTAPKPYKASIPVHIPSMESCLSNPQSPPMCITPQPPAHTSQSEIPVKCGEWQDQDLSPRSRAQSASVRRDHRSAPKRPVKSAGPIRPPMTPAATQLIVSSSVNNCGFPTMTSPSPTPVVIQSTSLYKPKLDPPEVDLYDNNGNVVPDYDEEKNRYGWGVEVHGNPYKYKKIPRRLPYTIKVKVPEVAPGPPRIHMETNETFFQNTIPRRPLAFSINKDWVSEILHAKRMELQQRDGVKYQWKKYAFVY